MIPPALPEVRKPVSEADLKQLKNNTAYPARLDIPDDHHLEPPSKQVSHEVDVIYSIPKVGYHVVWVFRSEESAVLSVTLLWQRFTQTYIKELKDLSCFLKRLEK